MLEGLSLFRAGAMISTISLIFCSLCGSCSGIYDDWRIFLFFTKITLLSIYFLKIELPSLSFFSSFLLVKIDKSSSKMYPLFLWTIPIFYHSYNDSHFQFEQIRSTSFYN